MNKEDLKKEFQAGEVITEDKMSSLIDEAYLNQEEVEEKINISSSELQTNIELVENEINSHKSNLSNPHGVTATQIGAYTKTETDSKLSVKADKTDVDIKLSVKADKSTTYTKTEVDSKISAISSTGDAYTKTETDTKLATKADKSTTYTKTEVDSKIPETKSFFNSSELSYSGITLKYGDQLEFKNLDLSKYDLVSFQIKFSRNESDSISTILGEGSNYTLQMPDHSKDIGSNYFVSFVNLMLFDKIYKMAEVKITASSDGKGTNFAYKGFVSEDNPKTTQQRGKIAVSDFKFFKF